MLGLILVAGIAFGAVKGVPFLLDRFAPSNAAPMPTSTEDATGPDEQAMANPVGCLQSAVSMQLGLSESQVNAGSRVQVPVTITNTGEVPCLLDVGNDSLTMVITSGDDTIWTTAQCPAGNAERRILLPAGGVEETAISWSGRRSAADCPRDTNAARAGTYQVQVSLAVDGSEVTQRRTLTLT